MATKVTAAVIGQGYVGLPLSVAAAESGINVIGIDIEEIKVLAINSGKSPVEDISDLRLKQVLSSRRYKASSNFAEVANAQIIIICVPTPLDSDLKPDLKSLIGATNAFSPYLNNGSLVISESTSYPGTLREVIFPIVSAKLKVDLDSILFASAPERVNPGDKKWNITNTPRLVGGLTKEATDKAAEFYLNFCNSVIRTESAEVAEAAKLLENTFRLVNIALMHEMNQVLAIKGIDLNAVVDAASTKPYGYMPFRSGVGVGGHCIPVDPLYLTWWARESGTQSNIVELADKISRSMPSYVAERALSLIPAQAINKRILVLGVAYKPGLADTRETPVHELILQLKSRGAEVRWHDPLVDYWNDEKSVEITWDCDVAVLATNQPGIFIESLISKGIPVLDCTNTHKGKIGIYPL